MGSSCTVFMLKKYHHSPHWRIDEVVINMYDLACPGSSVIRD
jgi:hypothetical protein